MKKRSLFILGLVSLLLVMTACSGSKSTGSDKRETIAKDFLQAYYTTTNDAIKQLEVVFNSESDQTISADEAQKQLDVYATWLQDKYSKIVSKDEIERLIANREMDKMANLAIENDCVYEINEIELTATEEKDQYTIYNYKGTLMSKPNDSTETNTYTVNGQVLVELMGDEILVNRSELQIPNNKD